MEYLMRVNDALERMESQALVGAMASNSKKGGTLR